MRPTILITRPEPKGAAFAKDLQNRWSGDLHVILSPLLKIVPLQATLPNATALIFTSTNGVQHALRLGAKTGQTAYCVGEATGEAARQAGFAAIIGPGDAAALTEMLIQKPPQGPVAHIRGQHARGDIATTLSKAGIACDDVVAYDQKELPLTRQAIKALHGTDPIIIPLFSPRTAVLLAEKGPYHAPLHVVAISNAAIPRIPLEATHIADQKNGDAMRNATIACLDALTHR